MFATRLAWQRAVEVSDRSCVAPKIVALRGDGEKRRRIFFAFEILQHAVFEHVARHPIFKLRDVVGTGQRAIDLAQATRRIVGITCGVSRGHFGAGGAQGIAGERAGQQPAVVAAAGAIG